MNRPEFNSVFAPYIARYLEYKEANGFKEDSYWLALKKFDRFASDEGVMNIRLTTEQTELWKHRSDLESDNAYYKRINKSRSFLEYLLRQGEDVTLFSTVKYPASNFLPHIFTQEETERYFYVVDTHEWRDWRDRLQLPVIFRLLCCCGTRVTETLLIKKNHVDTQRGIIKLTETKNNKPRYIVLDETMAELMRSYASKFFFQLNDSDYIFQRHDGGAMTHKSLYKKHRIILEAAGIKFMGEHEGPRVHDWRHTFCVNSFQKMKDSGIPLYTALPLLVRYLGHESILCTEKYIHLYEKVQQNIDGDFSELISSLVKEVES